jgi:hypothetical protein
VSSFNPAQRGAPGSSLIRKEHSGIPYLAIAPTITSQSGEVQELEC